MPEMKTIQVPSSKGCDIAYTISYTPDLGYFECTCPSFFYRGTPCKHIQQTRDSLQKNCVPASENGAGWSMELEPIMKTAASTLAGYRKAVEAGEQPKALSRAFLAGMTAALDVLTDPFTCPMCSDRVAELLKEVEELTRSGTGN